ncbi:MAG: hypothetical protein MUC97_14230 [Bernardetiaceae bacterium]|nr:hypothetical protein [Bernardetiaceae bacterium]
MPYLRFYLPIQCSLFHHKAMNLGFGKFFLIGAGSSLGLALLGFAVSGGQQSRDDFLATLGTMGVLVGSLLAFIGLVLLFTPQRPLGGRLLVAGLVLGLVGFGTCTAFFTLNLH